MHLAAVNPQLASGLLTFTGVLLGFGVNAFLQFRTDRRKQFYERQLNDWKREQELRLVRISTRAELTRIAKTILGQYGHIAGGNHFMWIPIYQTAFPTLATIGRAQLLTPAEIKALTAFYYSYQEHIGYLAGAAEKSPKSHVDVGLDVIGYDLSEKHRLSWLEWSLGVIERKALRALDALEAAEDSGTVRPTARLPMSDAAEQRFEPELPVTFQPVQGRGWVVGGRRRFNTPALFEIVIAAREGRRWSGVVSTDDHELSGCLVAVEKAAWSTDTFVVTAQDGELTGFGTMGR